MNENIYPRKLTRQDRVRQASQHRREQQRDQVHHLILSTAAELFLTSGYEGFSLRKVAEQIGYTPTTIYRYFDDKDDLLLAIVLEGFQQFEATLRAASEAQPDPLLRLIDLGRAYVQFGLAHPLHYQLMFMQRADLLFHQRVDETAPPGNSFLVLQNAVQAALDTNVVKPGDVRMYSYLLWTTVHGIVALAVTKHHYDPDFASELTETALHAVIEGIRFVHSQ